MKHTFWKFLGAAFSDKKDGHNAISLGRAPIALTFLTWITLTILQGCGVGDVAVPMELSGIMSVMILGKVVTDARKK